MHSYILHVSISLQCLLNPEWKSFFFLFWFVFFSMWYQFRWKYFWSLLCQMFIVCDHNIVEKYFLIHCYRYWNFLTQYLPSSGVFIPKGIYRLCFFVANGYYYLCYSQFSSVTQSCLTLWDPMNHSMPGLPVHHHLLEFTQTHIHRVSDAIQPSGWHGWIQPLSSPSPPAPNPSQHQGLFQWVSSSHEVARVLEFQL